MGATGQSLPTRESGSSEVVELLGELERSLDDRGRLSVPTAFRWAFVDGAVVLRWPGPCVAVLPLAEYRTIEEDMRVKERERMGDARAREALNSLANHCRLDAAGRLFVPAELRRQAGFDRHLLVVGQRRRLELWARTERERGAEERWQALVAHISTEAV